MKLFCVGTDKNDSDYSIQLDETLLKEFCEVSNLKK